MNYATPSEGNRHRGSAWSVNKGALSDALKCFVGELVGEGAYRAVFEFALDPQFVVKIEFGDRSFCNVREWATWHDVKDQKAAKWFAPCRWISPGGSALVQRRTTPLEPGNRPRKIPYWMTDRKAENYGTIDGQFCCHDYAFMDFDSEMTGRPRLSPAHWRN